MSRRTLQLVGLVLALLGAAVNARGQEPPVLLPIHAQLPELPELETTVQRLPFVEPQEPKLEVPISPNTGMPQLETPAGEKYLPLAELAIMSNDYIDPRYVVNSQRPDDIGIWERTRDGYGEMFHSLWSDTKRFYWSENLLYVGAAVAIVAPFANTELDQRIRDGYQRQAAVGMNRGVDQVADGFKQFGEYQYAVPAYLVMATGGYLFPDSIVATSVGRFGERSVRALAIGAPTVGILQYGLGAGRPFTGESHWQPFRNHNSASGHAFVGAVPFLTAASMVENRALKAVLIAASFGTGWSRIHHDAHYTSQVLLGWSIAYLAVESVNWTEAESRFRVIPIEVPNGVGMGVHIQY